MDKATLKKRCEDTLAAIEAHEMREPIQKMMMNGGWLDLSDTCELQPNTRHHWYRPKRVPRVVCVEVLDDGTAGLTWFDHEPNRPTGLTKFVEVLDDDTA